MKFLKNKRIVTVSLAALGVALISPLLYSHCQIPCGIYGDADRFKMMAEDITTIEKSMNEINKLSSEPGKNINQLVRWVNNKEVHADKIADTITTYFMAQRIKPVENTDSKAYEDYIEQITLLHRMLVTSMKCKQTSDLKQPAELSKLLGQFQKAYSHTD